MKRRSILGLGAFALASMRDIGAGMAALEDGVGKLVVSGEIAPALNGRTVYDIPRLRSLEMSSFKTITPWTEGVHEFAGTRLDTLMQEVGARSRMVRAIALNDYSIVIDMSDPACNVALIAFEQDGQPLRVRDKGPFWIVFPFSEHPELLADRIQSWSVWQLDRLEVLPS